MSRMSDEDSNCQMLVFFVFSCCLCSRKPRIHRALISNLSTDYRILHVEQIEEILASFGRNWRVGGPQGLSRPPNLAHLLHRHDGSGDGEGNGHGHGHGSDRDHHRCLRFAQAPCCHSSTRRSLHSEYRSEGWSRAVQGDTRSIRRLLGTISI